VKLVPCHAGDIGDTRTVRLDGVEDLENVEAIEAHVARSGVTATLSCSVADASERTVIIALGTAESDWLPSGPATGQWLVQIEVTFDNGDKLTWPSAGDRGAFTLEVYPQLG